MATKHVLVDDLTGEESPDVATVFLQLEDDRIEIDLSAASFDKLSKLLARYFTAGRPAAARRSAPAFDFDPRAVRDWAEKNGIEVSPKGRVPADIVQRWKTETTSTPAS